MMEKFRLCEEMRNDVINMSWARDKEKSESPTGIEAMTFHSPVGCFNHWATKDLWQAGPYTRFMYDMRLVYY